MKCKFRAGFFRTYLGVALGLSRFRSGETSGEMQVSRGLDTKNCVCVCVCVCDT